MQTWNSLLNRSTVFTDGVNSRLFHFQTGAVIVWIHVHDLSVSGFGLPARDVREYRHRVERGPGNEAGRLGTAERHSHVRGEAVREVPLLRVFVRFDQKMTFR